MVETSTSGGLWPSIYQPFSRASARMTEWLSPASEASSDGASYRICVELPGVAQEDVTLAVHNGYVTLKGEKREHSEQKGEDWYFSERSFGTFSRSFRLPSDADGDAAEANLKDGVLTIDVPKVKSEAKSKSVKISKN